MSWRRGPKVCHSMRASPKARGMVDVAISQSVPDTPASAPKACAVVAVAIWRVAVVLQVHGGLFALSDTGAHQTLSRERLSRRASYLLLGCVLLLRAAASCESAAAVMVPLGVHTGLCCAFRPSIFRSALRQLAFASLASTQRELA